MKKSVPLILAATLAFAGPTKATTSTPTQAIVDSATAFLNSLNPDQRQKVSFPFTPQKAATAARFRRTGMGGGQGGPGGGGGPHGGPDDGKGPRRGPGDPGMGPGGGFVGEQYGKAVWSNYPVSDVPRPGLTLGSLTAAQRDEAMSLLRVLLSSKGYQKVLDIMGSDQALSDGGTPFSSGTNYYIIGIFGTPSASEPWMLQFGGHHLALNVVMAGEQGVITPTLTGAQPAVYTSNGKTVRVLAQENDKAFVLLNALDDAQRKRAILNYEIGDLVLGPGHAGETIVPEGLKASEMNENQRKMLLDLISERADIVNSEYAMPRMADIKSGLDDTYFAWSGRQRMSRGKMAALITASRDREWSLSFRPKVWAAT